MGLLLLASITTPVMTAAEEIETHNNKMAVRKILFMRAPFFKRK
jgi:hypothetical protein